jgi:hypothetical protein
MEGSGAPGTNFYLGDRDAAELREQPRPGGQYWLHRMNAVRRWGATALRRMAREMVARRLLHLGSLAGQ